MKVISQFILIFSLCLITTNAKYEKEANIPFNVKNFWMKKCYKNPEALDFQNVKLETRNYNIVASGKMIVNVDLVSPIQVSIKLKKKEFGLVWIPVPCINGIGSCTYNDACNFGTSINETCPENFEQSHFPCRCPIYQGVYKLSDGLKIPKQLFMVNSWTSGLYGGQATVKRASKEIGCYQFGFSLFD